MVRICGQPKYVKKVNRHMKVDLLSSQCIKLGNKSLHKEVNEQVGSSLFVL